jgi:hypothetical protein
VLPAYWYVATLNGSSHAASMLSLFWVWTSKNPFSKKNDLKRPTVFVNFCGFMSCVIFFSFFEFRPKKNLLKKKLSVLVRRVIYPISKI